MQGKTAFIIGIFALALCWSPFTGVLLAILGIAVSAIALSKNKGRLAAIGLVLSIAALVLASFVTYAVMDVMSMLSSESLVGLAHDTLKDECGIFGNRTVHSINDSRGCLELCSEDCISKGMNLTMIEFNATIPCNRCECFCRG